MLPKYADIELPLLQELARRDGQARPGDRDASANSVYEALADHFGLTPSDRAEVILERGTARLKWENMVRYAVRHLRSTGNIEKNSAHGVWVLA